MSDAISRFEKAIQRINLIYGLLVPILIGLFMGRILNFTDNNFFRTDAVATTVYFIVCVLGLIVLGIHLKSKGRLSKIALIALYLFYTFGLTLLVLFLDPYPTPFYFQFIVLLVGIDLMFGQKWQKIGIVYFSLVFLGSYIKSTDTITLEGITLAITYILGSTSVVVLVSKYRRVSDDERAQLGNVTSQNAFERQRLLSLINNMGEAVIATDNRGKILLYNAAVLALLDTNQTLDGKSLGALLNLKDKEHNKVKFVDLLKQSPVGMTSTDYVHEFSTNDFINMYINIAPIKLGFRDESESGFIVIMRDITKEKSLEEERDEFISVVSHELRTPVAIAEGNISNAVFMNQSDKAGDKKVIADSLNQAHDQVLFLASMINDLATLSRAERTDTALDVDLVDPAALIHAMAKDYQAQASAKQLALTASVAKNVKNIYTSQLYLHEILQNFVTNSIKYTRKGGIIMHVRTNKAGDAVFSVADTGIGLSKADQKRVFDKFFRSEDYRTRESSGTGLGLYVTAKLAHRLGAQIALESELNKGTTFTITVPSLEAPKKHRS